MIIWIDDDVLECDFAEEHAACAGIEAIFGAYFRGEHYVFATRAVLRALSENPHFAAVTRNMIRRAENALTQSNELLLAVTTKLTIVREGHVERSLDGTKWRVPLPVVGGVGLRRVILLAENIDDARLLLHAGDHYKLEAGLGACRLVADSRGGGGSGIAHEFEAIVRARAQFCLCVTDGDRSCAQEGDSATSKKCSDCANSSWVVAHIALLEREIENLLPPKVTEEVIDIHQREAWERLMTKCVACDLDLLSYCDLKNGTMMCDVWKLAPGSPCEAFWGEVVHTLRKSNLVAIPCDEKGCPTPDSCTCEITPGFGNRLIAKANQLLEGRSPHASLRTIKSGERVTRWLELGREVFCWCCAPAPVRI